jgi:hypothetical protein
MALSVMKDETGSARSHEMDLSTILAAEERVELTLLVTNIAEIMRKKVVGAFDVSINTGKRQQPGLAVEDKTPNVEESKPREETDEEEKTRNLREKREKELSAPKMLELKKDSLEFFDKWRESIISQVSMAVNNPNEIEQEQQEKASAEATSDTSPPNAKSIGQ